MGRKLEMCAFAPYAFQAPKRAGKLDLATIGANARRATEDSSSIAFIGEPTKAASRFTETILEEAGIRQYAAIPGAQAMRQVLAHLESS